MALERYGPMLTVSGPNLKKNFWPHSHIAIYQNIGTRIHILFPLCRHAIPCLCTVQRMLYPHLNPQQDLPGTYSYGLPSYGPKMPYIVMAYISIAYAQTHSKIWLYTGLPKLLHRPEPPD